MNDYTIDQWGRLAPGQQESSEAAHFQPDVSFAWMTAGEERTEDCCYHNVATCPDCGTGMVRLGGCFSCPGCGWGCCG